MEEAVNGDLKADEFPFIGLDFVLVLCVLLSVVK
jgi:hypothetical protein